MYDSANHPKNDRSLTKQAGDDGPNDREGDASDSSASNDDGEDCPAELVECLVGVSLSRPFRDEKHSERRQL